jgi:acyl-CoA synthetase (AMP-forming)/AMP-acid ligase II
MLIPMADVPRWYAERKPRDTIAISHGADTLTWEQLERGANRRARAFAAKGVKPGDFVAIGLPNGNAFFETSFAHPKVRCCVVVGLPDPELGQRIHAILELDETADAQTVAAEMGGFLADRISRTKHPESFEIVSVGPRDDSGKVRRTLLRDERAAWLRENRQFQILPSRGQAKAAG